MQPVSSDNADDPDENQPLLTQAHAMETVPLGSRRYSGLSDSSGASPATRGRSATTADAREASAAAGNGDVAELQRLAAKGADLSAADYDGRRPLHISCAEGRTLSAACLCSQFVCCVPTSPHLYASNQPCAIFGFYMLSLLSRVHQRSSGSCVMDA